MKKSFLNLKFKKASALVIVILVFFSVFILSVAASYLVFLNTSRSSNLNDNFKAYYAARAGVERATFEAFKNNFPFFKVECSEDVFSDILENKSKYRVFCQVENNINVFYSLGEYHKSQVILEIPCINLEEECRDFCLQGSLCGGGKLMDQFGVRYVFSPPACNFYANECDNHFLEPDERLWLWEKPNIYAYTGATNPIDGQENVAILDPQNNPRFFMAAKYCDDLDINGFSDWYLPASEELYAGFKSSAFNYFNIKNGSDVGYWTSTESSTNAGNAKYIAPFSLEILEKDKEDPFLVRCVRKPQ